MKYTHQIIRSEDGSNTLFVPELNETYHSTHGAVQEAKHVFFKMGMDILLAEGRSSISVLEIGFGTGLNAILAYQFTKEHNLKLNYQTVEAYPVELNLARQLNYFEFIDAKYQSVFDQMHSSDWNVETQIDESFIFQKYHTKLEDVKNLSTKVDVVFFDAFAPNRQAEMWSLEQLAIVKEQMCDKGMLVTYCANGQFKRNLKALGFEVKGVPGPPGKREMTQAFLL